MTQKTALYIALGLTTFILVAVGSIALAWPTIQQANEPEAQPVIQEIPTMPVQAQTAPSDAPQASAPPAVDVQTLMATIEARDAAYQAQIEQANQQLDEAYQRLQELEALNQELMQREQIYQQRLQESAQIIEAMSTSQSAPAATAYYEDDDHKENDHDDDRYEEDHDDDHDDDRYEKDDD